MPCYCKICLRIFIYDLILLFCLVRVTGSLTYNIQETDFGFVEAQAESDAA